MGIILKYSDVILKCFVFLSLTLLIACNEKNADPYAHISATVQGNNTSSNKSTAYRFGKNDLPSDTTRVDFIITDTRGVSTTNSITVSNQAQTISFRVEPHLDLTVTINVYSGSLQTFTGESIVPALRPGQTYPLNVELIDLINPEIPPVIPPTATLTIQQDTFSSLEGDVLGVFTDGGFTGQSVLFTVTLSELANGNVTVDYATDLNLGSAISSDVDIAIDEVDYFASSGTLTIPAGSLTATFEVPLVGDITQEIDENFIVNLTNPSANIVLGVTTINGIIVGDDYPERLNDTGSSLCADYSFNDAGDALNSSNNELNCVTVGATTTVSGVDADGDRVPAGQDAHFGRDPATNDGNPLTGSFSYTKLDINGNALTDQTQDYAINPWACVKDNYTGLIWEVKTIGALGNKNSTYTWFNSSLTNDGGDPGLSDGGTCIEPTRCDTEKFVTDFNAGTEGGLICGISNWRLPTVVELRSLIDNSSQLIDIETVAIIDGKYFPNTVGSSDYWTSMSLADPALISSSWVIDFFNGASQKVSKSNTSTYIRLVSKTPVVVEAPVNVAAKTAP